MDARRTRGRAILGVAAGVVLVPPILSAAAFSLSSRTTEPFLQSPPPEKGSCVEDSAWMRTHHMDYLKQLRDEVVRDGVRGTVSLRTCSECHVEQARFCDKCHEAVDLRPDCWDCHDYSSAEAGAAANPTRGAP